jgi:hypothetical protein
MSFPICVNLCSSVVKTGLQWACFEKTDSKIGILG